MLVASESRRALFNAVIVVYSMVVYLIVVSLLNSQFDPFKWTKVKKRSTTTIEYYL